MSPELLDIPAVREMMPQLLTRHSVEQYHKLGELGLIEPRTELIRGIILRKMSRSPLHASIATKLFKRILRLLPSGMTARQEQPLTFSDSEPEPDVVVVSGVDEDFVSSHPRSALLVVEVAVTSQALDRANATLYAENGVQEYWIILPGEKAVEVYRDVATGGYTQRLRYGAEDDIVCAAVPEIRMRVSDILA